MSFVVGLKQRVSPRRVLLFFVVAYAVAALLAGILAVVFRPSRQLFVADGFGYYAYLPAVFTYHSLDFEPIYREPEARQFGKFADGLRTPIGRAENPFTIGPALVWAPGYLAARGLAATGVLGEAGKRPFGLGTQVCVWIWASLIGLAGLAAIYDLLKGRFGWEIATGATLAGFWATPVAAYLLFETGFSHSVAFALTAVFFWALDRARQQPARLAYYVLAGSCLGIAGAVRPTLVAASIIAVPALIPLLKSPQRLVLAAAAFAVPLLLGLAPQFIVWKLLYGSFHPDLSNTSWGHMDLLHPKLVEVLFSLDHGLFSWTPIWLCAFVGLIAYFRREPALVACILVVFVIHLWTIAANPNWNGDGAFGQRKFVDIAVIFFIGIGALASQLRQASRAIRLVGLAVALLFTTHNLLLMARYYAHRVPQSGPLTAQQLWGL